MREEDKKVWMGYLRIFLLGFILIILIWGMFYLGAYSACNQGGGILIKNNNKIQKYQCADLDITEAIRLSNGQLITTEDFD